MIRWMIASAVAGAVAFSSPRASAGDKAQCAKSYSDAQRFRKRGALVDAKSELAICLRECGDNVRADCAHWMEEVERAVPTLAVSVRKGGTDVQRYTLRIDGVVRADASRSVELDPGAHDIAVESDGEQRSQKIVLVEGEKLRRVELELAPPAAPAAAVTAQPASGPASPGAEPSSKVPWQTVVFGAAGVVGVAGFAGFALYGNSRYADLEKCRPDCTSDDVAKTKTAYRIGDAALGVGVVSLGIATVFYLLERDKAPPSTASAGALRF